MPTFGSYSEARSQDRSRSCSATSMHIRKSFENYLRSARNRDKSTLEIYLPPFWIKIQITGPTSGRGRRTILLMIFRKLRELWDEFRDVDIYHVTRGFLWTVLPPRPISFRETPLLDTPLRRVGYALRFRRHRNRLTLREVSELTGINLGHLSEIERGKHHPSKELVRRIESALATFEEEGIICLSTNRTLRPKDFRKSASGPSKLIGKVGKHFSPSPLAAMFKAQQELGASKIDSDPPPNA